MAEAPTTISAQEKYNTALRYKADGNAAYKAKDYKLAIRSYHKALLYVRGLDQHAVKLPQMLASADQQRERQQRQQELTEQLTQQVDLLKVDIYNNLTACMLQGEGRFNLKKILEYCDEVVEIQPTNGKCWYRRGQAYLRAGDYEMAENALVKAKSTLKETDPAVERLLATCRQKLKLEYQKQKSMYQDMFGLGGASGDAKT